MGDAPVAFEDIDFTVPNTEADVVAGFDRQRKRSVFCIVQEMYTHRPDLWSVMIARAY